MSNLKAEFFAEMPNRKGLISTDCEYMDWLERNLLESRRLIENQIAEQSRIDKIIQEQADKIVLFAKMNNAQITNSTITIRK